MNVEELRLYCLGLHPKVTEGFPFGEDILVFKIGNKMFALISLKDQRINLKCEPEKAIQLREENEDVLPGFHMNKQHWNTIKNIENQTKLKEWIKDSFGLIVSGLPKKVVSEWKL